MKLISLLAIMVSCILAHTRPSCDSIIVTQLREAGTMLLRKTKRSEWDNLRAHRRSDCWSPIGGQSYVPLSLPAESRRKLQWQCRCYGHWNVCFCSGNRGKIWHCVQFHRMTKLWNTSGSVVEPAGRCAVVDLKPTVRLTSRAGLIPCNQVQDTVETLTKGLLDAARVLDLIRGNLRVSTYAHLKADMRNLQAKTRSIGIRRQHLHL